MTKEKRGPITPRRKTEKIIKRKARPTSAAEIYTGLWHFQTGEGLAFGQAEKETTVRCRE